MLTIADKYQYPFSYTQAEVEAFAAATGDNNPIHLDAEFAAKTKFQKPIMHGMLGASIFSQIFGTKWPGEGTVYMSQTLQFKRPMFASEAYEARLEVLSVNTEKGRAVVKTDIISLADDKLVTTGEAEISFPR